MHIHISGPLLLSLLLWAGCGYTGPQLTPGGSEVRLIDERNAQRCSDRQVLTAAACGQSQEYNARAATTLLRNRANHLGATALVTEAPLAVSGEALSRYQARATHAGSTLLWMNRGSATPPAYDEEELDLASAVSGGNNPAKSCAGAALGDEDCQSRSDAATSQTGRLHFQTEDACTIVTATAFRCPRAIPSFGAP